MIAKILGKEEVNAAIAIALTGTIAVLVAKGNGPLSPKRTLSGALSNPVPRSETTRAQHPTFADAGLGLAA